MHFFFVIMLMIFFMNGMNVSKSDVIAYRARLAAIQQSDMNNNVTPSKNIKEHKEFTEGLLSQLRQILLDIDNSQMSLADKVQTAAEAERYFNTIIYNDKKSIAEREALIKKKLQSISNSLQRKLNSELYTPEQQAMIAEYKKRKEAQKRRFYILLAITIVLTVLTVGILAFFFSKALEKKQEESIDLNYKKQEEIMNSKEAKLIEDNPAEKIVEVEDNTYKLDKATSDIIKNNKETFMKYPNGEPSIVKAYKNRYFALTSLAPITALVSAMIVDRTRNVLDNGGDEKVEEWMRKDEEFKQRKEEMKMAYDNVFDDSNYNGTMLGGIGGGTGLTYGRAVQNLRKSYDEFSTISNIDNGNDLSDLDIIKLANGEGLSNTCY